MKTKKLIAALLVIMMVAALLPFGAMAEEASPSDAAEPHADRMTALSEGVFDEQVSTLDNYYISVNGQELSAPGQTVKCGSGTAKLTSDNNGLVLTLTNATISKTETLGSGDGITYYGGLVYSSYYETPLRVKIVGSCTMTAPAASTSTKIYEGIYADESMIISGGSL